MRVPPPDDAVLGGLSKAERLEKVAAPPGFVLDAAAGWSAYLEQGTLRGLGRCGGLRLPAGSKWRG